MDKMRIYIAGYTLFIFEGQSFIGTLQSNPFHLELDVDRVLRGAT